MQRQLRGRRSRSPESPPPLLPPAESPPFFVIRAPPQLQPVVQIVGGLSITARTLPANVLARRLRLARPPPSHRAAHALQGEQRARARSAASHSVEKSAARRRAAPLLQPAQATARIGSEPPPRQPCSCKPSTSLLAPLPAAAPAPEPPASSEARPSEPARAARAGLGSRQAASGHVAHTRCFLVIAHCVSHDDIRPVLGAPAH